MAIKKYYIGSTGPFYYDDSDLLPNDAVNLQLALRTDGQCLIEEAPSAGENALRLEDISVFIVQEITVADIDNPTELRSQQKGSKSSLAIVTEAGNPDKKCLYVYDSNCTASEDLPYLVKITAANEAWIAIAGNAIYGSTKHKGSLQVGAPDDGDYFQVEADGTIEFNGDGTIWDDLKAPATSLSKGGVNDPDFGKVLDDGAASTGVYTYLFDKTTEEELFLIVQFPHGWKVGSTIYPHVHWMPTDTDAGSVIWGMEYSWQDISGTFGNTTTIYVSQAADGTAFKHQLASFSSISGSGISGISSVMLVRLFRYVSGLTDDYDNDAALLEFDIHYEIDTVGSREGTSK